MTTTTQKPVEILVRRDAPTASREYCAMLRSAAEVGDLVSSSLPQFRLELTDRIVEFVPASSIAFRIRGRVIASYEVAPNVDLTEHAERCLKIAEAAGGFGQTFCHRCEKVHHYCECDEYAHLGTHSAHPNPTPHPMGE